METSNPRESTRLAEMVYLCDVDASDIPAIKDAAENAVIHNESPGYNCQDYVLELLDALEEHGIIDNSDANYITNRETLEGKQEGLA
jgi:hypothetical protein